MAEDGSESVSGESVEVVENEPRPSRSCKRLRNEQEWKRVKAKMARNSGKEYKSVSTGKVVEEKKIGPPCRDGCFAKVTMPVISVVFKSFWDLASYDKQTAYLQRLVHSAPVKRRRKPLVWGLKLAHVTTTRLPGEAARGPLRHAPRPPACPVGQLLVCGPSGPGSRAGLAQQDGTCPAGIKNPWTSPIYKEATQQLVTYCHMIECMIGQAIKDAPRGPVSSQGP
ncbi:hypothetical protein GWK47_029824 [Chionoecetes opilio]|uniref:Uncharacterized protein n=1 Tax=Chionoecetes opilio TaxID=41210 RepID=A0A8J4YS63_CHIOP|nr:hypothetical protein GWK47_029824 [Chionoecetes opilio]